jgi:hypothetical protein
MVFFEPIFPISPAFKLGTEPLLSHTIPVAVLILRFFNISFNVTFPYDPVTSKLFVLF